MVAVEVEPAEQVIQAAAAEFDAGRWAEARDRYAEATQLWTSLERNALERDAAAKEEAQERRRQALEAEVQQQLAALEHLEEEFEALGIPPGTGQKRGTLQAGLDAVAQLEQTEGRDEALDQLETLREQVVSALQETKASLQDWLQRDLAALGESWRELAGRAGAFLPQQQAEQFEQQLSSVRRAVTDQQWESARSGLREGRALLQQAEQVARSEVERTVQATFGEVVEALEALKRSDEGTVPTGFDLKARQAGVEALMSEGQFVSAHQEAEAVKATLAAALEQLHRGQIEGAAAAREQMETVLREVDLDVVRAVAAAEVEQGNQAQKAAVGAEERDDYRAATAAYEAARVAYQAASALLVEQQQREVDSRKEEVQALLAEAEGTAAEITEPAREIARQALEPAEPLDRGATLALLARAREELTRSVEEAALFALAAEQKQAADAAEQRITGLPLTAREQRTAHRLMSRAVRAFDRRQWAEAREQYAEAAEAWGPLIHEGEARARADSERGQQLEAARQRLRVLVEQAGEAPAEVVGDVLAKAEQMLATQKPVIEAMQEAEVQLTATLAEVPLFSTAAERRNAAQEQERRTLALQPRRRQLGAARKLMREAEAAFTQHNWDLAQQRYPAAADAFASLEHILVEQPTQVTTRDEERPRTTRRLAAIAAGLLLVAGSVVFLWRSGTDVVEAPPPSRPAKPDSVAPPPPIRPRIASAEPTTDKVNLKENETQIFSVAVNSGSTDEPVDIQWTFRGRPVDEAQGKTTWKYTPDHAAATEDPSTLTVQVGSGEEPDQFHSWTVDVEDVNRQLRLVEAVPPPAKLIQGKLGERVNFHVEAEDADGDALDRRRETSRRQRLYVAVAGVRRPKGGAGDSRREERRSSDVDWKIAALTVPKLELSPRPRQLTALRFQEPQQFELVAPADLRTTPLQYAWKVDGRQVSDTPSFVFQNDDARLVRSKPVDVVATVHDDQDRAFSYEWEFNILPPPPKIIGASPAAGGQLEVEPGTEQTFKLTAAPPVGNQTLIYVYEANGTEARSSNPTYEFVPQDGQDYTIVASVTDNYGQSSQQRTWKVKPLSMVGQVEDWLREYGQAINRKDVPKLAELMQFSSAELEAFRNQLRNQRDLRVAFNDLRVEKVDTDRVRASYRRVDEFTDARTGAPLSLSTSVNQDFRLVDGRVELER